MDTVWELALIVSQSFQRFIFLFAVGSKKMRLLIRQTKILLLKTVPVVHMQEVCHCWFYKETSLIAELHILNKTKVFPEVNQPDKANLFLLSCL